MATDTVTGFPDLLALGDLRRDVLPHVAFGKLLEVSNDSARNNRKKKTVPP
jgi:hypothetical protein